METVAVTNGILHTTQNQRTQEMFYKSECECLRCDGAHILTAGVFVRANTQASTKIKPALAPRRSPVCQRLMELSAFGVNTAAR